MPTSKSENPTSANSPDFRSWIQGIRPKTLIAAFVPVFVASTLAAYVGYFRPGIAALCLLCAVCLQIATNLINDASDFLRGADTEERLGPKRMAQSGKITPRALYGVAAGFLALAFFSGLYLVWIGGTIFLWLGLGAILAAIAYTAGPFPLAYLGLGDLFVFIFFGLVAVVGCFALQTSYFDNRVLLVACAIGMHATSLIAINNTRDIATDTKAGKRTLSVRLGDRGSRVYYSLLLFVPYLLVAAGTFAEKLPKHAVATWLSLPLALYLARATWGAASGSVFVSLLGKTALHHLVFALLLGGSFLLGLYV